MIPVRRLPNVDETNPTRELTTAAPEVPAMNIGAACSVACGPKTRANRTMCVGKIAELPNPATAAPTIDHDSLETMINTPAMRMIEHNKIRLFSETRRETIDATPRPRTKNKK